MHFPCTIEGKLYSLYRSESRIAPRDVLHWLEAQNLYPKVVWKERGNGPLRVAAGSVLCFPSIPRIEAAQEVRLYGGMSFSPHTHPDSVWQAFPQRCFWLPQIELSEMQGELRVIRYGLEPQEGKLEEGGSAPCTPFTLSRVRETPTELEWERLVAKALNSISCNEFKKIVLARQTTSFLSPIPSLGSLLSALPHDALHTTLFAFQLSAHSCFFGATPELLFKREGDSLYTEALAGTWGIEVAENELLRGEKELREFHIVQQDLEEALLPLTLTMAWEGRIGLLKMARLQHLYQRLHATLRPDISDATLYAALHPTAALGGYPKKSALEFLSHEESFDRGWYGAPVGVISPKSTTLYVAIRSSLFAAPHLHQFAGVGIVEGSRASAEWNELNQKLGVSSGAVRAFFS